MSIRHSMTETNEAKMTVSWTLENGVQFDASFYRNRVTVEMFTGFNHFYLVDTFCDNIHDALQDALNFFDNEFFAYFDTLLNS